MVSGSLSCLSRVLIGSLVVAAMSGSPSSAETSTRHSVSQSIANQFTTTVPLKQCEYPRLWSRGGSGTHEVGLRETRIPFTTLERRSIIPLLPSERTRGLFLRITHYYAELGYTVPETLTLVDSPAPNAFVRTGREVVLTTAMALQVTDPSEVAFILAHEVAHVALGHHVQGGISAEVAADTLALKAVTALGFNPCSGSSVLERLGAPSQLTLVSVTPRLQALHHQTSSFCG